MALPLQLHYLEIEWQGPGCARGITVAPEPVEIEERPDGTFLAETQVFHGLCPWVGLRLDNELSDAQPAFEGPDGSLTPMLRIDDGSGRHWWVQNNGWDAPGKRHLSELHRSMGTFTIAIDSRRLQLNNVVDALRRVDVEEYLRDFQQDLIWLVMGFGGATAAAVDGMTVNEELVEALETFAAASRRILSRPASQMQEINIDSRPSRLRPNVATFRRYLRNPSAHLLPGRGATETFDIAENRYVRHMVQACKKLTSQLAKSATRHATRFADRARVEVERSANYRDMTHRKVDSEVFDQQLADLKKKLARVESYRDATPQPGEEVSWWEFRPGSPFSGQTDQIFYSQKDGRSAADSRIGVAFSVLRIPEALTSAIQNTQSFCDHYALQGVAQARKKLTKLGKPYREVHFTSVYSIKPFTAAIDRKSAKRAQLEKNNWLAPLTPKERMESQQEAITAQSRGRVYQEFGHRAIGASTVLNQCQADMNAQDMAWEKLQVVSSPAFPMGVRFTQSPDYTACQVAFAQVTALTQRSGLGVDALDAVERIGVLHASALYERWCLVKIISILMEEYRFDPESGWQERLVHAITGKPQTLDLKFRRAELGLCACLEIQPELPNGRRPDFRLRFYLDGSELSVDRTRHHVLNARAKSAAPPDLVMDAKFRTQWRKGELGRVLTSLIEEKNYGQQGDRVFILHPAPRAILKPTSPLDWGRNCDYGQEKGDEHRKGVIYLAPGTGEGNPERNLRRLIAMQLQATFPEPDPDAEDDAHVAPTNSFCIRCGTAHESVNVKQHHTQRGNAYWTLSCSECAMQTTRTHCFGCKSGILFKNGLQLTYHKTVADQVTNIVCPQCGKYFDNEVHGKSGAHDGEDEA